MTQDKILIIDLDETLLSVNSFPYFARYFLCRKFPKLSPYQRGVLWLKSAVIFAKRKIFGSSHATTKNALQKLWKKADDVTALENLLADLQSKIRPNMQAVVEQIKSGESAAILASAAAAIYVKPLAQKFGFSHVIATEIDGEENRAEEKRRSVLEYIEKQGWQMRKKIFFTDHLEDLPLIAACDELVWFGKEEEILLIQKSCATAVKFAG